MDLQAQMMLLCPLYCLLPELIKGDVFISGEKGGIPAKIRQLKTILHRHGYIVRLGKGTYFIRTHPSFPDQPIVLNEADHDDTHPYQIAQVCERTCIPS